MVEADKVQNSKVRSGVQTSTCTPIGSKIMSIIKTFCALIKTAKGKEKIFALFQFSSSLYKHGFLESEFDISLKEKKTLYINSFEKTMKNGRKLMKSFMFFDEIAAIEKHISDNSKFSILKISEISYHFVSMVYYFLDNLIWCLDNKLFPLDDFRRVIRKLKDFSSLLRCIIQIIIAYIMVKKNRAIQLGIRSIFLGNSCRVFKNEGKLKNLLFSLLAYRTEFRFMIIDLSINIMRGLMSCQSLNLPGSSCISHRFSAVLGVISATLSIYNSINAECRAPLPTHEHKGRKLSDNLIL
ncbi:unnamed protein product [Blepharisma stoltei]|uniref:Uncharacterized protein n=1 Tax=Blepharisma stoltei TaxID=1481888 RepID=A0AAU9JNJ8_9CILI|nr:unnamed protein product [Blepharisma stoltei]